MKYCLLIFISLFLLRCKDPVTNPTSELTEKTPLTLCHTPPNGENNYINKQALEEIALIKSDPKKSEDFSGMVKVPSGKFVMGGNPREITGEELPGMQPRPDEFPNNKINITGFWIDETEVTNAQFQEFVNATGYVTTAERPIPIEEIMAQLPEDATPPPAEMLAPAALVFHSPDNKNGGNLGVQDWWQVVKGANWKHPEGPGSDINGKENHPVVHVSWYDANAYAKWSGKRLPTEAEWEYAARGGKEKEIFPWGNDFSEKNDFKANFWQGDFPFINTAKDGFEKLAPVKSFEPNGFGLYDMAGNVWEWCNDWFHYEYYKCIEASNLENNPTGPDFSFDPYLPDMAQKVSRGGSFLCNDSYCSGYRVSARMKSSPDTGLEHTGFRCVRDLK